MQDTVNINDRFTVAKFAPTSEQIESAARQGFRSIINFQTGEEVKADHMTPDEEARVAGQAGLKYLHQPVDVASLSDELVDRFRSKAAELPTPVLAHCASGKRAAAMVMMHVACEEGLDGDTAIATAQDSGAEIGSSEIEHFVKDYINRRNA